MWLKCSAIILTLAVLLPCSRAEAASVELQCNASLPQTVCERIGSLLNQVPQSATAQVRIELGIPAPANLAPEGFHWQASQPGDLLTLQVSGKASHEGDNVNLGLLYGSYALLERLGFRFNHPFQPEIPHQLNLPQKGESQTEKPYWPQRGFTHHTMHPLEMTHVLNGWGPLGPADQAGWEQLRSEWALYLEWLVANRQNEVEWVLLEKGPWQSFSRSTLRQKRLLALVEQAHIWGLKVGIDVPLALGQQNAWRLLTQIGDREDEKRQIEENIDWLMAADFDFVTTELGLSEFHNAGDQAMLNWLNQATAHLADRYQKPFYTKIHISSGQTSERYRDPETNQPLNFNFLPHYADPRLGIMPHTVQIYSLDDPAPTYGHQDFSEMHRFIRLEAGKRPLLWFPEASYWVNYDINIPLFLPVYAARRLHDLVLLASEEAAGKLGNGARIQGQIVFSSGFEWGYWLNDRLAARAAWSPDLLKHSESQLLKELLTDALKPVGPDLEDWVALLQRTIKTQHRLLVLGQVQGKNPATIELRTGMAYLAGSDTWSEIAHVLRKSGLMPGFQTQPDRLDPQALRHQPAVLEQYLQEIQPLLTSMAHEFKALSQACQGLQKQNPSLLAAEICDGLEINALRADFVLSQYEHAAREQVGQKQEAMTWLHHAQTTLKNAHQVVARREKHYRADRQRIAGWGANPTAYRYGYLWQAHALHFWHRDLLAMANPEAHPCRLNIIDPLEVGLPDPGLDARAQIARQFAPLVPGWRDCLKPLETEPNWKTEFLN
jgi:hypothetical protein